jgi:large subunit ribosomal protein L25
MKISFEVSAEPRDDQGKGASRRLRHAGKVPAILYGGHAEPRSLALDHEKLRLVIGDERFYSSIISINVGAEKQPAIVKDVQMHPAKNAVLHVDLQRVLENEKIRISIPLHFKGEAVAPGVKQGGVVSHLRNEVEVTCLPKDLPEFVDVDVSGLGMNDMLYLADLKLPEGVEIPELTHGRNSPVVSVHHARAEEIEAPVAAEAGAVAAGAAAPAAATPAPAAGDAKAAAKPAAEAKGKEAKK